MLGLGIGVSAAQAEPAKATHEQVSQATIAAEQAEQVAQEAEEAQEAAQEVAEVAEEAAGSGARPAVSVVGRSNPHLASTRKINRLTREIRHLRHVKERIRGKIRELRELPGTSPRRGRGQLVRLREKLLQKRKRLFRLQSERSELKHP
jgi:hypothetical protein